MMKWVLFIIILFISIPSYSHNIDVETRSENGELVVQVWLGDDPGEQVEIDIYEQNGELRHSGQTNADGILRWKPIMEESLTIAVYAETGHETELELTKDDVQNVISGSHAKRNETVHQYDHVEMPSTRKNRQPLVNIIAGLGLILSIAAVWMAYRNQQKINKIQNELNNRER